MESAADGDLVGAERDDMVQSARALLADDDRVAALLAADSKVLLSQFVKHVEDDIGLSCESLTRFDDDAGTSG